MSDRSDASPTGDPLIAQAEGAAIESGQAKRVATLFDLRRLIGALFAVYGVILLILGLGASDAEIEKAAGWNLNLWVGIGMLVVAALFLAWAFGRPLGDELEDDGAGQGGREADTMSSLRPGAVASSQAMGGRTGGDRDRSGH